MASKCKTSLRTIMFEGGWNEIDKWQMGFRRPARGDRPKPTAAAGGGGGRRWMKGGCRETSLLAKVEQDREHLFLEKLWEGCWISGSREDRCEADVGKVLWMLARCGVRAMTTVIGDCGGCCKDGSLGLFSETVSKVCGGQRVSAWWRCSCSW